tara:strand:- start:442 stop:891 length:450 start_codon:yes stop_codon:yes gene_type:complete
MAEQASKKKKAEEEVEQSVTFEPVKKIEEETFEAIKSTKTFLFVTIGLLAYLIFLVIPPLDEKITYLEKDLNAVLSQNDRYKLASKVFVRDNVCAQCHLSPDNLLSGLQQKYPSFADLKAYLSVGHQRHYTLANLPPDEELMQVYRILK